MPTFYHSPALSRLAHERDPLMWHEARRLWGRVCDLPLEERAELIPQLAAGYPRDVELALEELSTAAAREDRARERFLQLRRGVAQLSPEWERELRRAMVEELGDSSAQDYAAGELLVANPRLDQLVERWLEELHGAPAVVNPDGSPTAYTLEMLRGGAR